MKLHKLFLILTLIFFSTNIFAQNNDMKARMEFEDAETAYQSQNYNKAITHLESAEKLLGKPTSKTRYLLIISKAKIFRDYSYEYKELEDLRALTKHYLDNYTTDTEKYREIYDLSNNMKYLPKTLAEYNQVKQQKEEQIRLAQQDRQMKEKQEAEELKKAQAYVLNFAKKYNYKPNITTSEFAALSSENEKLVKKLKSKTYSGDPWSTKNGPAFISAQDNKVIYFAYMLVSGNSIDSANEIFYDIQRNLAPQYYNYNKETATISINVPGVGIDNIYFKIFSNKLRIVLRRDLNVGEPAY
ncbi:hypothetical protein H1R17_01575 [Flavobacterium sp. xlx-214]|uniref:hypothetical protein n=1 Tax=unclassified Flavobacterium TaxID=196869 RepID=UPI0013D10B57|nr:MULTISPECIES: hypothetical protein [unclassified Flavobacterium]MBA5792711.1 hypothetical protein [Flavobacterium sp. xlx-221]QMI83855.1 hypothetical protein H1R17_01575 [Flavobacterium sp. xlx-214]